MLPISRPEANQQVRRRLTWSDWRPTQIAAVLSAAAVAILIVTGAREAGF